MPTDRLSTLTRMTTLPRVRLTAAALFLACIVPLSGCVALSIPDTLEGLPTAPTSAEPVVDPEPTPAPRPIKTLVSEGEGSMTFADGTTVDPGALIEWGDRLMLDKGWTLTSPDDGQGNWAYTTVDEACWVSFFQGKDPRFESADDRTSSLQVLAFLNNLEYAELEQYAEHVTEGQFQYITSGGRDVDFVSIDTHTPSVWKRTSVRYFNQTNSALFIDMRCLDDSLETRMENVYEQFWVAIH